MYLRLLIFVIFLLKNVYAYAALPALPGMNSEAMVQQNSPSNKPEKAREVDLIQESKVVKNTSSQLKQNGMQMPRARIVDDSVPEVKIYKKASKNRAKKHSSHNVKMPAPEKQSFLKKVDDDSASKEHNVEKKLESENQDVKHPDLSQPILELPEELNVEKVVSKSKVVEKPSLESPEEKELNNSVVSVEKPEAKVEKTEPEVVLPRIDSRHIDQSDLVYDGGKLLDNDKSNPANQEESAQEKEFELIREYNKDKEEFANNELIMLEHRDDDIVLGESTEETKDFSMTGRQYVKVFWKDYHQNSPDNQMDREGIQEFVSNRHKYYVRYYDPLTSKKNMKASVFFETSKDNVSNARAIIDNYDFLQAIDDNGDSLLNVSVMSNNYYMSKFLLHRGSKLNVENYDEIDTFDLVEILGSENIANLLNRAKLVKNEK